MITLDDLRPRVAAGAEWLDKHYPGWMDTMTPSQLDLSSTCNCVLGQVCGNFWDLVAHAYEDSYNDWNDEENEPKPLNITTASDLGFYYEAEMDPEWYEAEGSYDEEGNWHETSIEITDTTEGYKLLDVAWKELIAGRKAAALVVDAVVLVPEMVPV